MIIFLLLLISIKIIFGAGSKSVGEIWKWGWDLGGRSLEII
jgi:hypothetical protein